MINKNFVKLTNSKYWILNLINSILDTIYLLNFAFLLSKIIEGVFLSTLSNLSFWIILLFINHFLKITSEIFFKYKIAQISTLFKDNQKKELWIKFLNASYLKISSKKKGDLIQTLNKGMDNLYPYFMEYMPQFVLAIICPLILLLAIFFTDKISFFIFLFTYPILPIFMFLIGSRAKKESESQWNSLNYLSSHCIELLYGIKTLKIFQKDKLQIKKIFQTSEKHRIATISVLKISFLSAFVLELFTAICTAIVAVNLGIRLIFNEISFFKALFLIIIAPEFYTCIRKLGLKFHSSINANIAFEEKSKLENEFENDEFFESYLTEIKEIEFKNLDLKLNNKKVLNSISFKAKKGDSIAIIGPSGSGKTSILKVLCGLLKPTESTYFVNNLDINKYEKNSFKNCCCFVPQFPYIFRNTFNFNLFLSEENRNFYNNLNLKDFKLENFNNNLNQNIGDGESFNPSMGEIQKIACARIFLKKSDLVLFDEPSSAMDSETEVLFSSMINKYLSKKIVFIAAHRLSTLLYVDKIMILNEGNLIDFGTHKELLLRNSYYRNLIKKLEN